MGRGSVCRRGLFDVGRGEHFDVVPATGSRVSLERAGTGNRRIGTAEESSRRGQPIALG
jgi:hypothetical protein